ncbi:hypothetical protein VPHD528_0208 [Vibrio phage D528]
MLKSKGGSPTFLERSERTMSRRNLRYVDQSTLTLLLVLKCE